MSKRRPYFRAVVVKLECGHVAYEATSFYRITNDRALGIMSSLYRKGVWCMECSAQCQPTHYLGTARHE